jgi:hypothetical protein
MSDSAFSDPEKRKTVSEHEDLVRALTVERFTKWTPSTSANDRAEMVACPTVRDGLPFEPIARSVRARKYRRDANASRRSS